MMILFYILLISMIETPRETYHHPSRMIRILREDRKKNIETIRKYILERQSNQSNQSKLK